MRAVAIVMVVVIHAMGYCGELGAVQRELIGFIVKTIGVPVFFLVDGFLAATIYGSKNLMYTAFVRRSLVRLMVPWFIFTVFYTLARYLFESIGLLHSNIIVGRPIGYIFWSMYASVCAPQMYFLFSLFLIRLTLPLVFWIARHGNLLFFLFVV